MLKKTAKKRKSFVNTKARKELDDKVFLKSFTHFYTSVLDGGKQCCT